MSEDPGYGVITTGFRAKTLPVVQSELNDSLLNTISPTLNTQADSVVGQTVGIVSEQITQLWEQAQALYASLSPTFATGASLDHILALTGAKRLVATPTKVSLQVTLDPGATLLAGSQARSTTNDEIYETLAAVTNATASAAIFDVDAQALNTGPIFAAANTLTIIETPSVGWTAVNNPLDGITGTNDETDAEARARRIEILSLQGKATPEAIRANLLDVDGVTSTIVIENTTPVVDANGLPPHSFEAMVSGGEDQAIADRIWDTKAAGIQAFGTTIVGVTDSTGFGHSIGFSRPTDVDYYIELDVSINSSIFGGGQSATGVALVQEALADTGNALQIGEDILIVTFSCAALMVPGVTNATNIRIDTITPPVNTADIAVPFREIALFDTSRIVVNIV